MTSVQEFCDQHSALLLSFEEWRAESPRTRIHDLAFPVLCGYHGLLDQMRAGRAFLSAGAVIMDTTTGCTAYCVDGVVAGRLAAEVEGLKLLSSDQLRTPIHGTQQKETLWDLGRVFDPQAYDGKKSRYNHLTYPLRWLADHGCESIEVTPGNAAEFLPVMRDLFDRWAADKARRISERNPFDLRQFVASGYWRVIVRWLEEFRAFFDAHIRLVMVEGKPFAICCLYIDGAVAFDMTYATLHFVEGAHSQVANYVKLWVLREVAERGVQWVNGGLTLNKRLGTFKHGWPFYEVGAYLYTL